MTDRERIAELRAAQLGWANGEMTIAPEDILSEALDGWERALIDLDETRGVVRDAVGLDIEHIQQRDEARELVRRLMDVDRISAEGEHVPGRQHEAALAAEAKLREWGMA